MSYILVTYGYNQYNIFNTNTSTPTLIDNIKSVALSSIIQILQQKDSQWNKEIENSNNQEENLKKMIKATEQDLKVEEDKYEEAKRILEEKKKKQEAEERKQQAKEAKDKKKGDKKDKEKEKEKTTDKKTAKKGKETKTEVEEEVDNKPILEIKEKLEGFNNDLTTLGNNRAIYIDKRKKIADLLVKFRKKNKNKMDLKIDLIDSKGEKMNITSKDDIYANEYLEERTVYELNYYYIPEPVVEEKKDDKKKEKKDKKDEKKDDKKDDKKDEKKDEKKKDKKDDKEKKEEQPEPVLEPLKFDGYCIRTIEEDSQTEEIDDKNAKGKDKKAVKKK